MATGKKTYVAAALMALGAVGAFLEGEIEIGKILAGMALTAVGLGHKGDRVLKLLEELKEEKEKEK